MRRVVEERSATTCELTPPRPTGWLEDDGAVRFRQTSHDIADCGRVEEPLNLHE